MNSKQIILLAATIVVIFENANAMPRKKNQLVTAKNFNGEETSTEAFEYAYNSLSISEDRLFKHSRGILYEYLDHLYSAVEALCKRHVVLEEPLKWCNSHIHAFRNPKEYNVEEDCKKTVQEAIYLSFYFQSVSFGYFGYIRDTITPFIKYTNAKGPKDFCDEYNPNLSKTPVQIIEQFVFDSRQLHYQPIVKKKHSNFYKPYQLYHQPPEHGNEYFIFNPSSQYLQPRAQNYEYAAYDLLEYQNKNIMFDLNQQYQPLPAQRTEHSVFDPSSHHLQPRSKKYKHSTIDLNLQLTRPTTSVYPDKYPSFDNRQVGTSTSYVENDIRLDLNKSPPIAQEECE